MDRCYKSLARKLSNKKNKKTFGFNHLDVFRFLSFSLYFLLSCSHSRFLVLLAAETLILLLRHTAQKSEDVRIHDESKNLANFFSITLFLSLALAFSLSLYVCIYVRINSDCVLAFVRSNIS